MNALLLLAGAVKLLTNWLFREPCNLRVPHESVCNTIRDAAAGTAPYPKDNGPPHVAVDAEAGSCSHL